MSPLREILEANTRAPVNYMKLEAKVLAWHKAELESYGEKVREACATYLLGHIEKLISDGGRASPTELANVVLAAPLPPIEGEEQT